MLVIFGSFVCQIVEGGVFDFKVMFVFYLFFVFVFVNILYEELFWNCFYVWVQRFGDFRINLREGWKLYVVGDVF